MPNFQTALADNLREIVISLDIVAWNAVATGINFGELPLRQRFASAGGIFQGLDRRSGVARTKTFKTRLQRRPRRRECPQRRLFNRRTIGCLERADVGTRQADRQPEKHNPGNA